ncbi:hypothetical protein, partial [Alienimonas sp. DA493]|uniref:hypothetical protein n=1 Tax=Alienimonas sp. DA493 TaxID=3373605 RepID=UPI0037549639
AAVAVLLAALFVPAGCGYPEVSRSAYDMAEALENMADLQRPEQIPRARELIAAKFDRGEITAEERDLLSDIVDRAEAGEWEEARRDAVALMRAQGKE